MKKILVAGVTILFPLFAAASDLDTLQGNWQGDVDEGGSKITYRINVFGNIMTMESGSGASASVATAELALSERVNPKQLDMKNLKMIGGGSTTTVPYPIPTLYELSKDTWKICVSQTDPSKRPKTFCAEESGKPGHVVQFFKVR